MAVKLLDGVTADGRGQIVRVDQISQQRGSEIIIGVESEDFGGGTVQIYVGPSNGDDLPYPADNGSFTESLARAIKAPHNWYVQAGLSGATSPDPVTVEAGGD